MASVDKLTLRNRSRKGGYNVRQGRSNNPQRWRSPEPLELAYIAGLLDGEGHITIDEPRRQVLLGLTNTHLPVLEWVASFGGCKPGMKKSAGRLGTKPCYYWQMGARMDVLAFLTDVSPYMRIKQNRALEAIGLLRTWTDGIPVRPS